MPYRQNRDWKVQLLTQFLPFSDAKIRKEEGRKTLRKENITYKL
jgi:hypothetical protein